MPSTFFTTDGGDIILRAGPGLDSKHDFRVHKDILSLASPVFKDMLAFPQPLPDQNQSEDPQLPIVDVSDPPEALDTILRLIYPGGEPPKITDLQTLTALLSVADKYDIASTYPVLRDTLKTFLPDYSFRVYVVACRFGFSEEAKEAAKAGNTRGAAYEGFDEEVRHISSIDLLRWVRFVQEREIMGRIHIESFLGRHLGECRRCDHSDDGKAFYFRLGKAVGDAFSLNPCVGSKDLFAVLDEVPDHPLVDRKPEPGSDEFCHGGDDDDVGICALQPVTVREKLAAVVETLGSLNRTLLDRAFGKGTGSG